MAKHGILKTFIEKTEHIILNNIVILKDDEKIAEYHWEPEIRHNQYSISKSFTSLAIGLAIEEGLLALDDRVIDFFPEETPGAPGCMLKDLRVRHLLTMTIGHKASHLMGNKRYMQKELDWVKHSLSLSLEHKPGTKFGLVKFRTILPSMKNNSATTKDASILTGKYDINFFNFLLISYFEKNSNGATRGIKVTIAIPIITRYIYVFLSI